MAAVLLAIAPAAIARGQGQTDAGAASPAAAPAQASVATPPTPEATPASPPASSTATQAAGGGGSIRGTVKSGGVPLPGVAVTATNLATNKKYATTTDVSGTFAMSVPANGTYSVNAELSAFHGGTKDVVINGQGAESGKAEQVVDFEMQLASRVVQQPQPQRPNGAGPSRQFGGQRQNPTVARAGAGAQGRGAQTLNLTSQGDDLADASQGGADFGAEPSLASVGGGDAMSTADSVAVSGQLGQTSGLANFSEDDIRGRIQDAMAQAQRNGGAPGDVQNAVIGALGGMAGPGGFNGFGGPGGGGPRWWAGRRRTRRWWWWTRRRRRRHFVGSIRRNRTERSRIRGPMGC